MKNIESFKDDILMPKKCRPFRPQYFLYTVPGPRLSDRYEAYLWVIG